MIQLKSLPAFFFFLLLIPPSNRLHLVYPVIEETAVSEKHLEETLGKKSAGDMKEPCLGHNHHLATQKTTALFSCFSDVNQIYFNACSYLHNDGPYPSPQLTKEHLNSGFFPLS